MIPFFNTTHITPKLSKILPICMVFLMTSSLSFVNAQICNLGFHLGVSTYQGDISPLGWRISFEGAHVSKGAFLTYSLNDYVSVKAKYSSAGISATDNNALNEGRKARGLHFKSEIREFALLGEVELLSILPSLRKFKLQPYVSAGIALFKFNPKGKYRGYWEDLQPLGTEGQGMDGYADPYRLTEFSIPMGFGLRYQFNEEFVIGFEIAPRWTFTDYLDDVSGNYPDLMQLQEEKGDAAAYLSFPGYDGGIDAIDKSYTQRGNSGENDWYIITELSVAYRFDPGVYLDRRKGFQGRWKCPYN